VSAERLAALLVARGWRWPAPIEWLAETGSTNDLLKERARSGAPAWSVAIADRQNAGRGRRGNAWASLEGNLHLSLLLPVPSDAAALTLIPLVAGLAVAEAVEEQGAPARLKWPNDVLLGGRKLAGVLCELAVDSDGHATLVIGVGINGWLTGDQATEITLGIAGLIVSVCLSLWDQYKTQLTKLSALTPGITTLDEAKALAKAPSAPSVTTPSDVTPTVPTPSDVWTAQNVMKAPAWFIAAALGGAVLAFAHLDVPGHEPRAEPPVSDRFHHEHREIAA
jgi:BirA family biotin operon repressor/biotin-[acetyl-CoA-carboxylase] ligase